MPLSKDKMNTTTNVRKPVTMEEYLVYKALKEDKVPIVGYETPSRQFNVMTKVGYVGEAIEMVLGAKDVPTLANALRTFELEAEVKSALEQEVLKGIIELGKITRRVGSGFNAGLVSRYDPTPELMDATRKYGADFPQITEEVAKFLLYDKHSPLPEHEIGWTLQPECVSSGIEILRGVGKPISAITEEIKRAVQGKSGAYHTVKRYIEGIRPNKSSLDADIYRSVLSNVMVVLTPELLIDALREIRFSREEYELQKPATEWIHYNNLKHSKEYVDSGDYERMSDLRDGHPDAEPETYLKSLDQRIRGIDKHQEVITLEVNLLQEQLSPLVVTLEDLESEFGQDEFKVRGYLRVREEISSLTNEAEELRRYTVEKWSSIKQKLVEEKKVRTVTKLPWYRKILGGKQ